MELTTNSICNDLLVIPLEDGLIDISWAINTDYIRTLLLDNGVLRIQNLQDKIDFDIEIDTVNTFNSINLQSLNFSNIEKVYKGNMVFSAIVPFNKDKFEETTYYLRIKVNNSPTSYNIVNDSEEVQEQITINDTWSNTLEFKIPKNYTKDLVESMYKMVADFNAYNKEAKSANMYYIFQAVAVQLNEQFKYIIDEKNKKLINKSLPDSLIEVFGELFKFNNAYGISMEEYRRILRNLIIGYQNGGAWNYIKEVLKYLIGYTPELITMQKFYPWILRKSNIQDPENFSDRNYYNPQTNYYLFTQNYLQAKNKNLIMLTNSNTRNFNFIVKASNFFNREIDNEKIAKILDLLKSVYTKYNLNIDTYEEPLIFTNYIYVNDELDFLLASDTDHIMY